MQILWQRHPASALANAAMRQAWDSLNTQGLDLPFMSAEAMVCALQLLGNGNEQLLMARASDGPVAMLLLAPQGQLRWASFQPSQLPLGPWVARQGVNLHELASRLCHSSALGVCLVLSLTQLDPLQATRRPDAPFSRTTDYVPTAWLEVQGRFDDYWAARGKNLRQNLRKQRNKLAAYGIKTSMLLWHEPQAMAAAVERYAAMESAGWKSDQGTAIHPENAQGRFYTRLLEEAARRGEALLTEYRFDERTVAMNMGLLRGGTWTVLKTTYDESLGKVLSPASLLREEELRYLFEGTSIRRVEYYGRVMEWHTRLTDKQRMLYHLTTYRWPWLKRLAQRRTQGTAAANLGRNAAHSTAAPADSG